MYLNYTNILFSQGMMVLKDLYHAKPVKIHVFGSPAEGDLERLSKEANRSLGTSLSLFQVIGIKVLNYLFKQVL